jgi:transposase, IS5 family
MKLLNELAFTLENPYWAADTEFALLDTILTMHPEIYELVRSDFSAHARKSLGRKDSPTIEQILRGALYKEMKHLTYRELEYAQHDSRICALFIKLDGRSPISFAVWQKYISTIKAETLEKVMIAINKIAQAEGLEDFSKMRPDSTAIETNIHYPTNNSLMWDCIKTFDRILARLAEETGGVIRGRRYKKQAKKHFFKINNTKPGEKRQETVKKQLKLLRTSINQAETARAMLPSLRYLSDYAAALAGELKELLPKAEKVYNMTHRHELLGEKVPSEDKLYSIFEDHTDIIVKGSREATFGHKVNLATGKSNLIIDCRILDGNPSDKQAYGGVIDRIKKNYGVVPRDVVTDGGFASLENQRLAKSRGVINIVFNKIVGSLKNVTSSMNIETRLKKWRSGIEAVISNLKRGFDIFRCEWKTRAHFDAKVYWSVLAYNIRVMTGMLVNRAQTAR